MEPEQYAQIQRQMPPQQEFSYLSQNFIIKEPLRKNYIEIAQILGLKSFQMLDGSMYLSQNDINYSQRKQLFSKIKESHLKLISLNFIGTSQIILELSLINWTNLKCLFLDRNNISNIQPLITISDLCNLEVLSLAYNKITTVKTLIKVLTPHLQTLSLDGNRILEIGLDLYNFNELEALTMDQEGNILLFQSKYIVKSKPRNQKLMISIGQNKNYIELTQKNNPEYTSLFHCYPHCIILKPKNHFSAQQNINDF